MFVIWVIEQVKADALPKLVGVGFQIDWDRQHERQLCRYYRADRAIQLCLGDARGEVHDLHVQCHHR